MARHSPPHGGGLHPRPLTPREGEVKDLILAALSDKEISTRMGISFHTVRFHVSNIFKKFHVATRTQLVVTFFTEGLP